MSKYLINTTEIYRADSEAEAKELIETAKKETLYELQKYTTELKETKVKGEVVDEYYKVSLTKVFNRTIKEPDNQVEVQYL